MNLRYRRLTPAARPPGRAHEGDAGFDLHAAETASLGPGERASVGTGIAVAIPDGYAGLVLPRSGLAARHGIVNRTEQFKMASMVIASITSSVKA